MVEVGEEALDLLNVGEVAKRFGVSVVTVRRLIYAEEKTPGTGLESVKIGSRRLITPEAITAYKKRLSEQGKRGVA